MSHFNFFNNFDDKIKYLIFLVINLIFNKYLRKILMTDLKNLCSNFCLSIGNEELIFK